MDAFDIDDLIMSATAYYVGRRTASVSSHCKALVASWPLLSDSTRGFIQRVVENAFQRNRLGDDCDRESWETVRRMWSKK